MSAWEANRGPAGLGFWRKETTTIWYQKSNFSVLGKFLIENNALGRYCGNSKVDTEATWALFSLEFPTVFPCIYAYVSVLSDLGLLGIYSPLSLLGL